ncbi:MAG TPA: type II toxin-antitoxin system HicA family toxin [Nitrolancea sp.]|nr:type II toxin-antitoxin system HicA family toxin [Nitrolancea sp.]
MKVREVLDRLLQEGWRIVRQEGSHRQLRKEGNPWVITVPGKLNDNLGHGIVNDIRRKAGWK